MSNARLASDLGRLGVAPGDVLLVHASLRSLGRIDGGAEAVISTLLEVLGSDGTLLMPALSYEYVSARQPLFDPATTASCVGAIPETFRTRTGTLRSVHPTHSVCALGGDAGELVSRHHLDTTPVGANSPLALLPKAGGKILMLGCGLKPNTSMHGIEELSEPPYLFQPERVSYVLCNEAGHQTVSHRRHDFAGWEQRYDRIEGMMQSGLAVGMLLEAKSYLIDARELWEVAHRALMRDPFCFVEKRLG